MRLWLKVAWLGWLAILAVSCGGGPSQGAAPATAPKAAQVRTIEVTTSNFSFDPPEIVLHPGEAVAFVITNTEGVHTFTISELGLDLLLQENESVTTPFVAPSQEVAFRLVCRFHELTGMVGTVVVGAAPLPAAAPAAPAAGQEAEATPVVATDRPAQLQEVAEIENYAASRFYPSYFVVLKDVPVRLYISRLHREHVNRFTIAPFVSSTAFFPPGTLGTLDFTPTQSGEFRIVNEGHGYQAPLIVVDTPEQAREQVVQRGIQELALIHDFGKGLAAPPRLVVQQGVPVRIFTTGLGGEDKVAVPPFYVPAAVNVQPGKITSFDFTPTQAGEFPLTYEQHSVSATLVVEPRQ